MARKKKQKATPTTIANAALGLYGTSPAMAALEPLRQANADMRRNMNADALDAHMLAMMAHGTSAIRTETITNAEGQPEARLTLESLQRARDLLMQNDVPMYEMTASEVRRRHAEQEADYNRAMDRRAREEHERRHGRNPVEVEMRHRPDIGHTEIRTRIRGDLHVSEMVDERQMEHMRERNDIHHFLRDMARRTAHQMTRALEEQIFEQMMNAAAHMERPGRGRRSANWENMRNMMYHGIDMAVGAATGPHERPATPTPIPGIETRPKEVTMGKLNARLLADDVMVWDEGVAMGHCLGKSYTNRIMKGSYLAYHIDVPGSGNGLTLGLVHGATFGGKPAWKQEQLKGKANTTKYNDRPDIKEFCKHIVNLVNGGKHGVQETQNGDGSGLQEAAGNNSGVAGADGRSVNINFCPGSINYAPGRIRSGVVRIDHE